jgi:hypothetical protein
MIVIMKRILLYLFRAFPSIYPGNVALWLYNSIVNAGGLTRHSISGNVLIKTFLTIPVCKNQHYINHLKIFNH